MFESLVIYVFWTIKDEAKIPIDMNLGILRRSAEKFSQQIGF